MVNKAFSEVKVTRLIIEGFEGRGSPHWVTLPSK
jgi:hypothetical protein